MHLISPSRPSSSPRLRGGRPLSALLAAAGLFAAVAGTACGKVYYLPEKTAAHTRPAHHWFTSLLLMRHHASATHAAAPAAPAPTTATAAARPIEIIGSGSSFAQPLANAWSQGNAWKEQDTRLTYQPRSSSAALTALLAGQANFSLNELPLDAAQLNDAPGKLIQIPVAAAPVCVVYNIPNLVFPLKLTPKTLADIYLGDITEWDDEALVRDNPGVDLPATHVQVVHATPPAGTSAIFNRYLHDVSVRWGEEVPLGPRTEWPVTAHSADDDPGIAAAVAHVHGGIGYMDCSYAQQQNLQIALIQNKAGIYVAPTAPAVVAALNDFLPALKQNPFAPVVNAGNAQAYPITGIIYLTVAVPQPQSPRWLRLLELLDWVLGPGQTQTLKAGYAPVPAELLNADRLRVDNALEPPLPAGHAAPPPRTGR